MLRSINGVSEPTAKRLASLYKTPKELIRALTNPKLPVSDRQSLLEDKLSSGKSKSSNPKLSRRIFRIFSSIDDGELMNSDDESDAN